MADRKLHLTVVTPETTVIDAHVDQVVFPAFDGELGVRPGHAPTVARLGYGVLRFDSADGPQRYFLDGGFAQIDDDEVSLLTTGARLLSDIDAEAVRKQLAEVDAEAPTGAAGLESKLNRVGQLRQQLRLAKA